MTKDKNEVPQVAYWQGYLLFFLVVMLFVTIKKWKRNEE